MERTYSVVIPAYNCSSTIKRAINSVLNQTKKPEEIILVNDGSTDGTHLILDSFPQITIINQKNSGPSKARNVGIANAKFDYICFLDSDDYWEPDKIELLDKMFGKHPDVFWGFSNYIRENNNKRQNENQVLLLIDPLEHIINNGKVHTSTVVIKRSVFSDNSFLFNETVKNSEDRELWYKMALSYRCAVYCKKPLSHYSVTKGSLTKLGLKNGTLSFLSMEQRLETVLQSLDSNTKARLLKFMEKKNKDLLLTAWTGPENPNVLREIRTRFSSPRFLVLYIFKNSPIQVKRLVLKVIKIGV